MTLFRRISAAFAAMVLVLAVVAPALAWQAEGDYFQCPSRPTYLHHRWQGSGAFVPPGSWYEYDYGYSSSWRVATNPGEYGGGDWYAWSSNLLDFDQTYPYCN
jgi:hypothetical protein